MKAIIETTNNIQDIFFPVRLEKSEDLNGGMPCNPECVNTVVATIDGQDRQLATCGERYNLISNQEVYQPIMDKLAGYDYTISVTQRNNATFEVKFNITDKRLAIQVGEGQDLIYPQISLNRSYNGGSKYFGHGGYFRLICSNGLVIPVEGREDLAYMVKGKHTEKLSLTLEKLNRMVDRILENSKEISKKYEVLFDTKIENYGERVEVVMEATGIKKGYDNILATIRTEMNALNMDTANDWLVYNALNYHIYNANRATDEVRRELDKKVLAEMMK
jgi:hypothetical protein